MVLFGEKRKLLRDIGWEMNSAGLSEFGWSVIDRHPMGVRAIQAVAQLYDEITTYGDRVMSFPSDLPNPEQEYPDFLVGLMNCTSITNLAHYREAAGKRHRVWLAFTGQHMHDALQDEVVEFGYSEDGSGNRLNSFHPTAGAKDFWKNAKEEGYTPTQALEGWRALRSIMKDVKGDPDGPVAA